MWWWRVTPFLEQPSPLRFFNRTCVQRTFFGNFDPAAWSSEMVPFLRRATSAIASLGCEGAMRAIASSMSPRVCFPQQGPTPIFSAATAGGLTTVQSCVSAARTLPTAPTRERKIAARFKGYCTDRAIFTLLRCTTDELFFSCCHNVAAHLKHAATRQHVVPQAQANC